MTPFRWGLLAIFFACYLLLGGTIFWTLEQRQELSQKEELKLLRQDIQEILIRLDRNFYDKSTKPEIQDAITTAKEGVLNRISQVCQLDNLLEGPETTSLKWSYYNSVFFSLTVITTIGYGYLSPSTPLSKSLMIAYGLFGIPLNSILISGISSYFSSKLVEIHSKSMNRKQRGRIPALVSEIIFYLFPGLVVFIIIPAGVLVLMENWTFLDSVYYSFVTLTTIGFGDYVAGMSEGHSVWIWLYQVFLIVWVTCGLGYVITVIGLIAKAMKSKQVRGVLDKRITEIETTKDELLKEIEHLKQIVNDLKTADDEYDPDRDNARNYDDDDDNDQSPALTVNSHKNRQPSSINFDRQCSSLPRITREPRKGFFKRRHSDSAAAIFRATDLQGTGNHASASTLPASQTTEETPKTVVDALSWDKGSMPSASGEIIKCQEKLEVKTGKELMGQVSSDVKNQGIGRDFRDCSAIKDKGFGSKRENTDELESVMVHGQKKLSKEETDLNRNVSSSHLHLQHGSKFRERVGKALLKISSTRFSRIVPAPQETSSRKISNGKRKISHKSSTNSSGKRSFEVVADAFQHYHQQCHREAGADHSTPAQIQSTHPSGSLRTKKISRESQLSTSSYQTINETIESAPASRKNTPASNSTDFSACHPSYCSLCRNLDEMEGKKQTNTELESLGSSTSSLVNFLKSLDKDQERDKKTSGCSDASYWGSCYSELHQSDGIGLGDGILRSMRSKRPVVPVTGAHRKRKHGIFQPGFSFVNSSFAAEDKEVNEEEESTQ